MFRVQVRHYIVQEIFADNISHMCVHTSYLGNVRGVCNFLGSVSSQQKFEVTDFEALGVSQLSDSVTALCYSSVLFRK